VEEEGGGGQGGPRITTSGPDHELKEKGSIHYHAAGEGEEGAKTGLFEFALWWEGGGGKKNEYLNGIAEEMGKGTSPGWKVWKEGGLSC